MPLPNDSRSQSSRKAWIEDGFCTWVNAITAFKSHESSNLHKSAIQSLHNVKNNKAVIDHLSTAKQKEMRINRIALLKIFDTIRVLARQEIAFRGHEDDNSNFMQMLKMRARDVPELKIWLERKSYKIKSYKWLSHDIVNEILDMMANSILSTLQNEIKSCDFFALIVDETSDISKKEQVSLCTRIVKDNFIVKELFIGFYEVKKTNSETLFSVVKDFFIRFDLQFKHLRGQCYDGAANMSSKFNSVQALVRKEEPRALYIHCCGHTTNLVVFDAMENVICTRNFISLANSRQKKYDSHLLQNTFKHKNLPENHFKNKNSSDQMKEQKIL